ncbi:hypothetical protein BD770DRAFT_415300 [Pilaira anomala]|nr:hypothetical protein BD770DRAFT_415300 [Pilaira anomala]
MVTINIFFISIYLQEQYQKWHVGPSFLLFERVLICICRLHISPTRSLSTISMSSFNFPKGVLPLTAYLTSVSLHHKKMTRSMEIPEAFSFRASEVVSLEEDNHFAIYYLSQAEKKYGLLPSLPNELLGGDVTKKDAFFLQKPFLHLPITVILLSGRWERGQMEPF